MMVQTEQPRSARDAAFSVDQGTSHVSGFVGAYSLSQIEVRPEIYDAADSSL